MGEQTFQVRKCPSTGNLLEEINCTLQGLYPKCSPPKVSVKNERDEGGIHEEHLHVFVSDFINPSTITVGDFSNIRYDKLVGQVDRNLYTQFKACIEGTTGVAFVRDGETPPLSGADIEKIDELSKKKWELEHMAIIPAAVGGVAAGIGMVMGSWLIAITAIILVVIAGALGFVGKMNENEIFRIQEKALAETGN